MDGEFRGGAGVEYSGGDGRAGGEEVWRRRRQSSGGVDGDGGVGG